MFAKLKHKKLFNKVTKWHQARLEGDSAATAKEIAALFELAKFYQKHSFSKTIERAASLAVECYRNAAMLGDKDAQYIFADCVMKRANFWQNLSTGVLGSKMCGTYSKLHYEEAHAYLDQAIAQGHPLAKRLKGVALIRGWGIPVNSELGTKLVIESIKEEGTWDQATKIFEGLGLHSQEIFSALMKHQGS